MPLLSPKYRTLASLPGLSVVIIMPGKIQGVRNRLRRSGWARATLRHEDFTGLPSRAYICALLIGGRQCAGPDAPRLNSLVPSFREIVLCKSHGVARCDATSLQSGRCRLLDSAAPGRYAWWLQGAGGIEKHRAVPARHNGWTPVKMRNLPVPQWFGAA